jgi:hypothetical protein
LGDETPQSKTPTKGGKKTNEIIRKRKVSPSPLGARHPQFSFPSQDLLIPDFPSIPGKNQREIHPIHAENQGRIFGQTDQQNFRGIKPKVDRNNESIKPQEPSKIFSLVSPENCQTADFFNFRAKKLSETKDVWLRNNDCEKDVLKQNGIIKKDNSWLNK